MQSLVGTLVGWIRYLSEDMIRAMRELDDRYGNFSDYFKMIIPRNVSHLGLPYITA